MNFFKLKNKVREFLGLKPKLRFTENCLNVCMLADITDDNQEFAFELSHSIFRKHKYVKEVLIVCQLDFVANKKIFRATFPESEYHILPSVSYLSIPGFWHKIFTRK